jgi:hypothetical protein
MALLTDTAIITVNDLTLFEGSLTQVASSHSINLDSKIALATSTVSDKVMLWLLNSGGDDPQAPLRRRLGVSTIVMTPELKRWLCFETLARVFGEAYNFQLNTRYQGKWNEYQQEASIAANLCYMSGIGVVSSPLSRPATPLVSIQAGNIAAQNIIVATSWVDSASDESGLSGENAVVLGDNSSISVAMAEGFLDAPESATGWNVYAGTQSGNLTKQNQNSLAVGVTWDMPATGIQIGTQYTGGQKPVMYINFSRRIKRG